MKRLPWLLTYIRFLLTLPAIALGYFHILGIPYILLLAVAAATDYYDGKLARKLGVETAALRQLDSIADTIFFLGVLAGMFVAYPAIYSKYTWGIYSIAGLETVRYVFDIAKFRRGASYHALSAKAFGVSLLVATIAIMGFGISEPFFPIALVIGIISELEGLCMSFVLHTWTYNIKHIGVAIRLSNNAREQSN